MLRILISLLLGSVAAMVISGCRAPMPKFDPYAGHGSPRIAPPSTGISGTGDSYFTPGSQPANNVGPGIPFRQAAPTSSSWQPAAGRSSDVIAASHGEVGTGLRNAVSPASFESSASYSLEPNQGNTSSSADSLHSRIERGRLKTTDATSALPPGQFHPPSGAREISELPNPPQSNSAAPLMPIPMNTYNGTPSGLEPIPRTRHSTSMTPSSANNVAARTTSSADDSGWRPKYTPPLTHHGIVQR